MKGAGADGTKPLVWVHGEIRTPPLSKEARIEAGALLRQIQNGVKLSMPISRPLPTIDPRCHELRITDGGMKAEWRIIYCIAPNAILILAVFQKKTRATPDSVIASCRKRLAQYKQGVVL